MLPLSSSTSPCFLSPRGATTACSPNFPSNTRLSRRQFLTGAAASFALLLLLLYVAVPAARDTLGSGRSTWSLFDGGGRGGGDRRAPVCKKDPLVLVYNRIPKAGSTTLMALFKELSGELGYRYVTPEPYHDHARLRRAIFQAILDGEQTLIVNHFWYPEIQYGNGGFSSDDTSDETQHAEVVSYMNMVREPSARAVSDYYYLRYGSDRNINARTEFLKEHGDLSMDECYFGDVKRYRGACEVARDVQADYFCGREGHPCHDDGQEALKARLAASNMDAIYTVGVNERYEDSLRMLEYSFPAFFKGLTKKYLAKNDNPTGKEASLNHNSNKGNVSAALIERLERDNAIDLALWKTANAKLDDYLHICVPL